MGEAKNWLLEVVLWPPHLYHGTHLHTRAHTHTHTYYMCVCVFKKTDSEGSSRMIFLEFGRKPLGRQEVNLKGLLGGGRWKREINAFLRSLRATMFSIGFAWQQGTGDVRESENVQSIPKTTSGLPSWGKAPQSWAVRSRPLGFITLPSHICMSQALVFPTCSLC